MTFSQLYKNGKERLTEAGIESPAFDTLCIFEKVFGMNRQGLAKDGEEQAPNGDIVTFNEMIKERCSRRPLQYILGEWDFMNLKLDMGEGVLCAREDSAVLVEKAEENIRGRVEPKVLDLCAGTGAVGLAIAQHTGASVDCVELYDVPLSYLQRNIKKNDLESKVRAVRCDVTGEVPSDIGLYDAIVSNPPYIKSDEIDTLQEEVRREPREALDGGSDGYDFYRAILNNWLGVLKEGGLVAFEVGEGQAEYVAQLMKEKDITDIDFAVDFSGINRVVYGFCK